MPHDIDVRLMPGKVVSLARLGTPRPLVYRFGGVSGEGG
jgi:hypothetical protein